VPEEAWLRTLEEIRMYGGRRSEALLFWGGILSASAAQVTGVYLPGHRPDGAHAALSKEESRWLVRQLHGRDEKLIAQIHSHPGEAYHSDGDDAGAASFHIGFLSIVVPQYGRGVACLSECAIFEFDGTRFTELKAGDIAQRFRVQRLVEPRY
jgi:hypothetical protein